MTDTNWSVLTAGPSAGKTCTVNALALEGYTIRPEAPRVVMDQAISDGYEIEEIVGTESFQNRILRTQLNIERNANDFASIYFDRSVIDAIAYNRYFDIPVFPHLEDYVRDRYESVYVLEQLPIESDYARQENQEEATEQHELLIKTYEEFGYDIEIVPIKPIDERVEQILSQDSAEQNTPFLRKYSE